MQEIYETERKNLKMTEVYELVKAKRLKYILTNRNYREIEKIVKEAEEKKLKECTFQPNIHKKENTDRHNYNEPTQIFNKLYEDSNIRKQKIKEFEENKLLTDEKAKEENCTFRPKINKVYI